MSIFGRRYFSSRRPSLDDLYRLIKQARLKLLDAYSPKWVVDCKAVGSGRQTLIYLGRYLYRGVIQEKDILSCKHGRVTFRYQNSQTKQIETRTLGGVAL